MKQVIAKRIAGVACVLLGVGAFIMVLVGTLYNVVVRTLDGEAIGSAILYTAVGLTLFFTGKYLIKAKQKEKNNAGK